MKKIILIVAAGAFLASCGGKSATDKAKEVCDCFKKANGMAADDPNRTAEQDKCMKLNTETFKDMEPFSDEYNEANKVISECSSELIKDAFK